MITTNYQNINDRIKLVLLRTPMVLPKWNNSHSICPPLGLAYVAASLQQAGYEVRCIDALGEAPLQKIFSEDNKFVNFGLSTKEILQHLASKNFNVLFVSLMFSHEWPVTKDIIKVIKKVYPEIILVCGGEHINACPEYCMKECPEIDICVTGEGEETSVALLKAIEQKKSLSEVNGIVFRSEDRIIRNPNRSRINKLENIPLPAWDLFPLENYLSNSLGYGVNPGRTMPMLISRGSPYQCTFCSSPLMWTTKWQKIIKKNWNITWQMPAGTRSEALDDETLGLMVLSGQKHISYAPESGSKITLQKIKKKIKIERMKESIRSAISKGMSVKLNLMLGFPHETHKEMFQTLNFVKDAAIMGVTDVYIATFSPYPGSELFEQMYENGQIAEINDEYFLNLTSYSDLIRSYSYSKHVGHKMLTFYRLGGMSMFYIINFIFHPKRLFRVFSNIINKREETKLDKGLIEMIDRLKRSKKKRPPSYVP